MPEATTSRWDQIRKRKLLDPEFSDRYERTRRSIAKVQEVLRFIDAEREAAGLSKADLAHRVGANPAAVRRLLSSGAGNPTLKTVLDVMDALGIELRLEAKAAGTTARQPSANGHQGHVAKRQHVAVAG